jgi:KaiC/GvpD/RAD55 family RecA-like ATPase
MVIKMCNTKLTYDDLTHPLIKDKIILDYPFDVLLNRECQLQDYELGILSILEKYNTSKNKLWYEIELLDKGKSNSVKDKLKKLLSQIGNKEKFKNYKPEFEAAVANSLKRKKDELNVHFYNLIYIKDISAEPDVIENSRKKCCELFKESISIINCDDLINLTKSICSKCSSKFSTEQKSSVKDRLNELKKAIRPEKQRINEFILRKSETLYKETELAKLAEEALNIKIGSFNLRNLEDFLKNYFSVFVQTRGEVIGSLRIRNSKESPSFHSVDVENETTGSGNILIKGRPGSGKSTLALQMAVACTFPPNHYSSVYISFEESIRDIQIKAKGFNWQKKIYPIRYIDGIDDSSTPEDIAYSLLKCMTQPDECVFKQSSKYDQSTEFNPDQCTMHCNNVFGHNEKDQKGTQQKLYEPRVFLPLLSPRGLFSEGQTRDELFWERYRQLERLLTGIECLRKESISNAGIPPIRMVCIDSLNVLGDDRLSRNELFKLFDLLKSKGVIGVFTAEQESWVTKQPVGDSVEDYLADIIIQLHMEDDSGYANRYIEITKSRHQHQVYGIHPLRLRGLETQRVFRKQFSNIDNIIKDLKPTLFNPNLDYKTVENIINTIMIDGSSEIDPNIKLHYLKKYEAYYYFYQLFRKKKDNSGNSNFKSQEGAEVSLKKSLENIFLLRNSFFQPVTLQPSLHYIVYSTEMQNLSKQAIQGVNDFRIGCDKLASYHKQNLTQGSIITIKGPRSTYKTNIAHNFLLDGLKYQENVLLIAFKERSSVTLNQEGNVEWMREAGMGYFTLTEQKYYSLEDPKRIYKVYKQKESTSYLIELALKSGALLPEELLEFVRDILREKFGDKPITRVVLDDVALIGSSYPYLRRSKTSGELFLAAFVHVMKNYNVNLIITGTTGQMKEADEMVDRACELSDSVLACDFCDVFGDRYVTVTGDGMHSMYSGLGEHDFVPAVIRLKKDSDRPVFEVDTELLQGLVGFGTPHIYRPGLRLYTFKEGMLLYDYNRELQAMLSSSLGISWRENYESVSSTEKPGASPIPQAAFQNQDISVVSFDSTMSSALHDSLDIIENRPIDSTVIYTIDEFWLCPDIDVNNKEDTKEIENKRQKISDSFHDISDISGKLDCHGDFTNFTKNIQQIVPYYGNVMLIAYRKKEYSEYFEKELITWNDLANNFLEEWHKNNDEKIIVPYHIDSSASETAACLMLDALHNNIWDKNRVIRNGFNLNIDSSTLPNDNSNFENIKSIQKIISRAYYDEKQIMENKDLEPYPKRNVMHPYAGIYICWYSQLREMIHAYPELATKLDVCSMPGGGIRGDWYLGVAKGSVSLELGKRVIQILTSKKEQYKRFSMGVGLPTLKEFYYPDLNDNDFFAWQHSTNVRLKKLIDIHSNAHSRADIPGYKEFRTMLYTIGKQLIKSDGGIIEEGDLKIIVSRIQAQYELLCRSESIAFQQSIK